MRVLGFPLSSSSSPFSHQHISHHFSSITAIAYYLYLDQIPPNGTQCYCINCTGCVCGSLGDWQYRGQVPFFVCLQTCSVGIVYFSALTSMHGQIADRVFNARSSRLSMGYGAVHRLLLQAEGDRKASKRCPYETPQPCRRRASRPFKTQKKKQRTKQNGRASTSQGKYL